MGYKLTGPLGPVYLPGEGKIVLGRRTHRKVHKDKLCSRNQTEIVVEDDTVYATPVGVNAPRLTAKTNKDKDKKDKEDKEGEALELKKGKRYVIHLGDSFTLYSGEFSFTLELCDDDEREKEREKEREGEKRKHGDSDDEDDGDENPKKKQKKEDKPTCQYGSKCYRTNPEHLEEFYHPQKSKRKKSMNKSSDNEAGSEGEKDKKDKKEKEKEKDKKEKDMKWEKFESLYILHSSSLSFASKIASFDMDDTLIKTKSGNVFPKGRDDWQWKFPSVPKKLKAVHNDGYRLVIFTNQAGISTNTSKADDIKGKISDISKQLGLPIIALVSTAKDKYRKPSTAVWDYFAKKLNGGTTITDAIFVGDAAGRSPGDGRPKKDHSATDRAFAENVGIDFQTPEEYFLGEDPVSFRYDMFDPKTLKSKATKDYDFKPSSSQELIILVGFPASGKTTFAKRKLIPHGYVHVNQDTLKTKDKCLKAAKQAMENGSSVVVDNTNPGSDTRAEYLSFAKKNKITARCFYFDIDMQLATHLNKFRELITNGEREAVPGIAYNMYKGKLKIPNEEEGFEEVVKIKFSPEFDKKADEKMFYKFM